jgi:hypothetical protein
MFVLVGRDCESHRSQGEAACGLHRFFYGDAFLFLGANEKTNRSRDGGERRIERR